MTITMEVKNIMDIIELIIKAAILLFGVVSTCCVTIPKIRKVVKQRLQATTDAEKAEAELAIREHIMELIGSVESSYKNLDKALKNIGESAGSLKKDKVMSEMRDYCDEHGYAYNKEAISTQIDEYVTLTNEVNVNKQK